MPRFSSAVICPFSSSCLIHYSFFNATEETMIVYYPLTRSPGYGSASSSIAGTKLSFIGKHQSFLRRNTVCRNFESCLLHFLSKFFRRHIHPFGSIFYSHSAILNVNKQIVLISFLIYFIKSGFKISSQLRAISLSLLIFSIVSGFFDSIKSRMIR